MEPASSRPHLSVVIAAYNEEEQLGRSIPAVYDYLAAERLDAEVLVVDDGSRDDTAQVASRLLRGRRGRVLRHAETRGRGYALRRGALAAEGRWLLLTDAGLSVPIEEHAKLATAVRDHDLDVAIGSRVVPGAWEPFNLLVRWITGLELRDTQCGLKLLDLERTRLLFERTIVDRSAFDVELLFLCTRFGLSVREVPVRCAARPRFRAGRWLEATRMLGDVLRVRWRFGRGAYQVPAILARSGDRTSG